MCGEHDKSTPERAGFQGSSPHVRGAPSLVVLPIPLQGIIPACAGSTRSPSASPHSCRDHPRMCGEHRGELKAARAERGIIPACAGSTGTSDSTRTPVWDHPRMCGEHIRRCPGRWWQSGSSPHVRGAHRRGERKRQREGIIPACAGSTLKYLAFLGYSSAFSFGSQGSKLFTCVVSYPPNFRAL